MLNFHHYPTLQRLLGSEAPPNKILEIKNESLGSSQVLLRDDAMVLYAPAFQQGDKKSYYEIVLQRSCVDSNTSSFSLYSNCKIFMTRI
uniref:Uncharacterized protein n=1 Tax=Megaselia scalaris TaxID=36166 RepID=T1GD25_MEGSC